MREQNRQGQFVPEWLRRESGGWHQARKQIQLNEHITGKICPIHIAANPFLHIQSNRDQIMNYSEHFVCLCVRVRIVLFISALCFKWLKTASVGSHPVTEDLFPWHTISWCDPNNDEKTSWEMYAGLLLLLRMY